MKLQNNVIISLRVLLGAVVLSCTSSASLLAQDYVECPENFIDFLDQEYADSGAPMDAVFFRTNIGGPYTEWNIGKLWKPNKSTWKKAGGTAIFEIIFLNEASDAENYYVIKSARHSTKNYYPQNITVEYGTKFSSAVVRDFKKRFQYPPFQQGSTKAVFTASDYQEAHQTVIPADSRLISSAWDLFDLRRGWHLWISKEIATFSQIAQRNNFAFPPDLVAESDRANRSRNILDAQIQRIQDSGIVCVRIEKKVYSSMDKLYVDFLPLFRNAEPIAIQFEFRH